MQENRLGVAIHGAGNVARAHVASWLRNPDCHIASVGSRSRESAERLVREMGLDCPIHESFEQMLADPHVDVVNISGPNHVHAEQGIAAAQAGKHLLVEKPICLTADENRALRDAVVGAGVRSVVSFVLRWNPLVENLRSLRAAGAIGELVYVEVDYWHALAERCLSFEWAHTVEYGRSAMLFAGCHAVDAIRRLTGDEVVEVSAYANNKKRRFDYPANVVAILKFRNGAIGKTSVLFDGALPYQFNIDLVGTEGTLRDNRLWSKRLLPGQTGWSTLATILPDSGDVHHHPFDAQINHFVDCIRQGHESHCSIADAYHTHEICLAVDRSIDAGGTAVRLPS